jgi:glycosyltransferase involved in cell wall biosynthesis
MNGSRMLRIGIDLTAIWRPNTGILVYAARLARELLLVDKQNKYTFFFAGHIHPEFRELEGTFRPLVVPLREEVISKQLLLPWLCNSHRFDVIHFPAFPPPVACFRPFIWTLHDATPWLYPATLDLKGRVYFQYVGGWAARFSKAIITDSNDAKRNIVAALGLPEVKVNVIHLGIDDGFRRLDDHSFLNSVRLRYGLPEKFMLCVGTLEPRKNLPFLIRAYRQMRQANQIKLGLVIVGRTGWKSEALEGELGGDAKDVVLTGFVPQADLVALYNMAEVFVLPSLYEGFGFPPLEAMACGCPVIISDRGSLPEVVADAALLIDPTRLDSLVAAIHAVETSPSVRKDLVRKGFERVDRFSWRSTAVQTMELYRAVAARGTG